MLSEFDLIRHTFPDEITIYPVADVHLGAVEHAENEWQDFLKKVEKENAYLILAGDLINNSIRSAKFANPFDEALRPREAKARMVEYLKPIKDRILCVVTGNHEARTLKDSDQDLTYDICSKLDIEHLYRETIAYMGVGVGERINGKAAVTYTFAVTHGSGGGIYTGAAVNRNERFGNVVDGLDCLVVGHVHKGFISKPGKIEINIRTNRVSMKHYVVISCVPWLNYGGYAAKAMLLPAQTCDPQKITLTASGTKIKKIITTW
jgi:predicted phosphodiesterase